MALRLQLMPQAVRALSTCQAAVRERVLHELGALLLGPPLGTERQASGTEGLGSCQLPSGFHVRYSVDRERSLLELLELRGPEEGPPAPMA